jgi:hypothetical protein
MGYSRGLRNRHLKQNDRTHSLFSDRFRCQNVHSRRTRDRPSWVASGSARCNIVGPRCTSIQPMDLNPAKAVAGVSCWGADDAPSNLASPGYHW